MRAGWLFMVLVLAACPAERPQPDTPPPQPPVPVTQTATRTDPEPTRVVEPIKPDKPIEPTGCAPRWADLGVCQDTQWVYASARADAGENLSLALTTAADRARRTLAVAVGSKKNSNLILLGAEVPHLSLCEGQTYALARAPLGAQPPTLAPCSAGIFDQPEGKIGDCPAWAARVSWRDPDGTLYGIGRVDGMRNAGLAERTAGTRALANAAKIVKSELRLGDGASTTTEKLAEIGRETARCDDAVYVKVAARAL